MALPEVITWNNMRDTVFSSRSLDLLCLRAQLEQEMEEKKKVEVE